MPVDQTRRGFLMGKARQKAPSGGLRPPWSVAGFETLCTGCNRCVEVCETSVLQPDPTDLPRLDFTREECSFCGACVEACEEGALDREVSPALPQVAEITGQCLDLRGIPCRLCEETCEARALNFRLLPEGRALPEIDQAACNGCGACVHRCPEQALRWVFPKALRGPEQKVPGWTLKGGEAA